MSITNKLKAFYKSDAWLRFRLVAIAQCTDPETGFVYCAYCGEPILKKYDLIVHHKEELTEFNVDDAMVSLNPDNTECVHFRCHNALHHRFGYGTGGYKPKPKQVFIVYGAPCAGKTTWVRENATQNDLVVDMDSIWQMVSINDRYVKPDCLRSVVFDMRDKLYDVIKYRSGKWQDAYIITTGARYGDRERLVQRVGADDLIFIDTPKDECLQRARSAEFVRYINEWFDAFQGNNIPPGLSKNQG